MSTLWDLQNFEIVFSYYQHLLWQISFLWFSVCFRGLLTCGYVQNSVMFRLCSDVYILIQYTKEKSSFHLHPLQFAQNAPEGPVLDPGLENFPLAGGRSCIHPALSTRLSPVTSASPKTRIHHWSVGRFGYFCKVQRMLRFSGHMLCDCLIYRKRKSQKNQ